jgi:hypothetical protein
VVRHSLIRIRRPLASTSGLAIVLLLAGCQAAPAAATPTKPAPSATASIAFPTLVPTSTVTPGATASPTPDLTQELGTLLLSDPFDDSEPWRLGVTASGGSSVSGGRLSLSVRQPRAYQLATRLDAVYGDVLVEVDAQTELCTPGDEFGLVLRVHGLAEYYRFLIGCDGTARASRVLEEGSRALTWPVPSPAILGGFPARNHLAVKASGDTFHFLVNNVEVLSVRDVALVSGGIGLFARAGSGGQVSVAFEALTVYALKPFEANVPTATP